VLPLVVHQNKSHAFYPFSLLAIRTHIQQDGTPHTVSRLLSVPLLLPPGVGRATLSQLSAAASDLTSG
jgi:hypothetical protein